MQGSLTRTDLLAALISECAHWDELLDEIDEHQMDEPGVVGQWSVKLVIAHVMVWERWAAEQVRLVTRWEPSTAGRWGVEAFDAMNKKSVAPYVATSPRDVRAESDDAFGNLLGSVERLEPAQLDIRGYAPWSSEETISEVVAGSSFRHYPEHMEEIREWLERTQD